MAKELPFNEWDSLPMDAYKLILAELKERFDAEVLEIISVTEKTTRYIFGFLTFLFATSVFIFTKYPLLDIIWVLFILAVINTGYGVSIIMAREGYSRGLILENIVGEDFDKPSFSNSDKEKLAYWNTVKSYELKIEGITVDNKNRAGKYNSFVISTLILIGLIALNTLLTIYSYHTTALF